MELNKTESFETPSPPQNVESAGESAMFSIISVFIMFIALIGGGYYFLHKTGAAQTINNALNAPNSASQQ